MDTGRKALRIFMPVMIIMCLFLCSCTRTEFSIDQVSLQATAVASHHVQEGFSTLSEGLAVVVGSSSFSAEEEYQVSVHDPSGTFSWEFVAKPTTVAEVPSIVKNDLLLPPDATLESGAHEIELYLKDGRRLTRQVGFIRPDVHLDANLARIAAFEPLSWDADEDGTWFLHGIPASPETWTYTLYDRFGLPFFSCSADQEYIRLPEFEDPLFRERTGMITAVTLDAKTNILLVLRTFLT
ncbi:MAG: hypothetical protein PHN93_03255 [Sphaerochaetaceae bacterium]|nr:hypothetical protein [Sphaerochaetaceae bacterium]